MAGLLGGEMTINRWTTQPPNNVKAISWELDIFHDGEIRVDFVADGQSFAFSLWDFDAKDLAKDLKEAAKRSKQNKQ